MSPEQPKKNRAAIRTETRRIATPTSARAMPCVSGLQQHPIGRQPIGLPVRNRRRQIGLTTIVCTCVGKSAPATWSRQRPPPLYNLEVARPNRVLALGLEERTLENVREELDGAGIV